MTPHDAAAVLHLPVSASEAEIRAAYKIEARMWHPDRFVDGTARDRAEAAAHFIRVSEAYEVLLRHARQYPSRGSTGTAGPSGTGPSAAGRPPRTAWVQMPPPEASEQPAPPRPVRSISPAERTARSIGRWALIGLVGALGFLLTSGSIGLTPESIGVRPESPWYPVFIVVGTTISLTAAVGCAAYAGTGRPLAGRVAVIATGTVLGALFLVGIARGPLTISTLFLALFVTAIAGAPFAALLAVGRLLRDRRTRHPR